MISRATRAAVRNAAENVVMVERKKFSREFLRSSSNQNAGSLLAGRSATKERQGKLARYGTDSIARSARTSLRMKQIARAYNC